MESTDKKTPKLPIFQERFSELAKKFPNKTEFAKFLDVGQQTVNYWLNGDRVPDASYLIQIAEKTGVSIDWLLGISTSSTPDIEIKAICDYTGLSDKAVEVLHNRKFSDAVNVPVYENGDDGGYTSEAIQIVDQLLSTDDGQHTLCALIDYFEATADYLCVIDRKFSRMPDDNYEEIIDKEYRNKQEDDVIQMILPKDIYYQTSREDLIPLSDQIIDIVRFEELKKALIPMKESFVQAKDEELRKGMQKYLKDSDPNA